MSSLYEISNQYQALMQQVLECEELSAEQLDALDNVSDNMEDKAKAVAAFIRNMEVDREAIEKAVFYMEERMGKLTKKIDSMREYLKSNLEKCNIKEVKSPFFDIRVKQNPCSVRVLDETAIPPEYYRETVKVTRSLDKMQIVQKLKENIVIPGVILEKRTRLEIA